MRVYSGTSPYRGYTSGPAFRWEGIASMQALYRQGLPVVLIADYLGKRELEAMELTRVVGIVIDHGSPIDPLWELLAPVARPSVVGARGIFAEVEPGETVIVDGVAAQAVLRPTDAVARRQSGLKGTAPPREPKEVRELLGKLCEPIRSAWEHKRRMLPFDCAEQRRLYEIAFKLAHRRQPSPEEDALVARLIFAADQGAAEAPYAPPA
jgi:hypothetical protein